MRPKKVIVLTWLPEHDAGLLRLVLRVRGYDVRVYSHVSEVVSKAQAGGVDLVISGNNAPIREIRERCGYVPTILLSPMTVRVTDANRIFYFDSLDMRALIESIRVLLCRRRGPVPKEARAA